VALAKSVNYSASRLWRHNFWSHPSTSSAERSEFQASHLPSQLGRGSSLLPRLQRSPALDSSVLDDCGAARSIRGIGRRTVSVSVRGFVEADRPGGEGPM